MKAYVNYIVLEIYDPETTFYKLLIYKVHILEIIIAHKEHDLISFQNFQPAV